MIYMTYTCVLTYAYLKFLLMKSLNKTETTIFWTDAQADPSHRLTHISVCLYYHAAPQTCLASC